MNFGTFLRRQRLNIICFGNPKCQLLLCLKLFLKSLLLEILRWWNHNHLVTTFEYCILLVIQISYRATHHFGFFDILLSFILFTVWILTNNCHYVEASKFQIFKLLSKEYPRSHFHHWYIVYFLISYWKMSHLLQRYFWLPH